MRPRALHALLAGLVLACGLGTAQAAGQASSPLCERSPTLSAGEQDTLLRFAGVLRARLERAMAQRSARVVPEVHARLPRLRRFANWAAYYVLRLGVVIAGVTGRY